MINIKTSDSNSIKPLIDKMYIPPKNSHKGQNGRVIVIGGSSLFHSASIWAAEIASHFVDIVHYSSTEENNAIFLGLKKKVRNGIVIPKKHLLDYVKEDEAVLVGPGMIRKNPNDKVQMTNKYQNLNIKFKNLLNIKNEGEYTHYLTKYLIDTFPYKKFVFDAGALQMMEKDWFFNIKQKPVLTPHQKEFERLFGINITNQKIEDKIKTVKETAKKYRSIILLKNITDIVSDGQVVYTIEGGNAGLTKGGTGDLLAGLVLSFLAKNDQLTSSVLASYFLKKSAEALFEKKGYWYNIDDLISVIPEIINQTVVKYL